VVDGCLLHPDQLAACRFLIVPRDLEDQRLVVVWSALCAAADAGEIDPDVPGAGYIAAGRRLEDAGRWVADVFYPGRGLCDLDWSDPVRAAEILAEAARRRDLAAELIRAGEAVATGADPSAVLRRLEVVT
jgi:hypothetical protein